MTERHADALRVIDSWGVAHAAAAVVGPRGVVASHGHITRPFGWASVTKLLTAWTVLAAVDDGLLELDRPAGPPGSTVRHLLAHASGLPFEGEQVQSAAGRRRIYSNPGYDLLGSLVAERAHVPFSVAMSTSVLVPLEMHATVLVERPSQGLHGPLIELAAVARELLRPRLVSPALAAEATTTAFPGLAGVVPGVGMFDPCDWGLGPELHGSKHPHWMGDLASPSTFGHFGGKGGFLWIDPSIELGLVVLTDRDFGPWALEAWPALSDAVVALA